MKILACIDLSGSTDKIVKKAEDMAKAFSAQLWLLHIAEPEPDFVGYDVGPQTERDFISKILRDEHRHIQEIADRVRKDGLDATALLVQGPAVETILVEATRLGADMIVVGSHGRGAMYRLLVGSVSEGILRGANCPVLVVPTHERI